ncbi:MAG: DUF2752 domain-containing protein [Cytophagales bacterium]|nr:DUF2752 domain-containing protein [Cytophagales bacterium]
MSLAVVYFGLASLVWFLWSINIFPPCLWKSLFHFNCPGCGLTHAFLHLVKGEWSEAYQANALVFLILPFGCYYLGKDYLGYTATDNI